MIIIQERQEHLALITMNRVEKHNAFHPELLSALQEALEIAEADPGVRVIILKANGLHFSAGADLEWMQSLLQSTEAENLDDAMILGKLMYAFYACKKPTIAMVQGAAFGGGAGLAAACHIAIASEDAQFCFSETRLGLIPAVISPYVVRAIGARAAEALFMSASRIDAQQAASIQLVQRVVPHKELLNFTIDYAKKIVQNAPGAVSLARDLVREVEHQEIDSTLIKHTASLIARQRISAEGQRGMKAFLNKETPNWD